MKLKKLVAGLTAMLMAGSLAACGVETPDDLPVENGGGGAANAADNASGGGETDSNGGDNSISNREIFADLYGDETIQLTVYSQLANYSGKLTGWFAELMKREFNVEMTIIPDTDGMYDTRMEAGNLGDIVVFGSNGDDYQRAVTEGMLFDWNEDNILTEYGSYIKEHMPNALENNMTFNESFSGDKVLYGFGHDVASTPEDVSAFMYTWDIRWDLYKELGYPEVKDLNDLKQLFIDMKKISPTDDNGSDTYALSLWPDWDGNMVMYVKAFATAYRGYDEMGFGHYDVEKGVYYHSLDPNSPYMEALKFFNELYREGLIDPNSMTQTYSEAGEKLKASGTFMSIFGYAGNEAYNTEEHMEAGKYMYTMLPGGATPISYGMNVRGGNRVWTIGASTEYPELCMAIINYLCTPEGYMTYNYGPKDVCWYYDENGYSCFTELGKKASSDRTGTMMPAEWGGGNFNDGTFQANNTTWSLDASNPDSNGETYNWVNWASERTAAKYDIVQDWRDHMGAYDANEYLGERPYRLSKASAYTESKRSDELKVIWKQVADCIVNYSWQAVYAKTDEDYNRIVNEMIERCNAYDPNGECLAWCNEEASIRRAAEDAVK